MTAATCNVNSRVKRCAVCKIDLKGRFVFVDDASEQLFGRTKEELFGRLLVNFVSEADHDVLKLILNHRNHYESFFERTPLHLVGADGSLTSAIVVISLNFVAGVPVNFQIIIYTDEAEQMNSSDDVSVDEETLLDAALAFDEEDWSKLTPMLRKFTDADWAIVYWSVDDRLEPWACCSRVEPLSAAIETSPQTTVLHRWVVESGEDYSFGDHDMVRRAIERSATAPNEYIAALETRKSGAFILRFIYSGDSDPVRIQRVAHRCRLAVGLLRRLLAPSQAETKND
jgi:PAS domain S-box-containing protein